MTIKTFKRHSKYYEVFCPYGHIRTVYKTAIIPEDLILLCRHCGTGMQLLPLKTKARALLND